MQQTCMVSGKKNACTGAAHSSARINISRADMTGTRGKGDVRVGMIHLGFRCVMSSIRQTG